MHVPKRPSRRNLGRLSGLVVLLAFTAYASGCAAFGSSASKFAAAWEGRPATMTTYNQQGGLIDTVKGVSFQVERDTTFDTTNSDGGSNSDSSVLDIQLGGKKISHVGSTLILAEDGLVAVSGAKTSENFSNTDNAVPWLNRLIRNNTDLWQGKARTILVRSQDGTPIAVYAGNAVTTNATDVPKSTWFQVDGRYLLIYRADYTVYDNALLQQ